MRKHFREQTRRLCDILKFEGGDLRLDAKGEVLLGVVQDLASEVLKLKMEALAWQQTVTKQQKQIEKMQTLIIGDI